MDSVSSANAIDPNRRSLSVNVPISFSSNISSFTSAPNSAIASNPQKTSDAMDYLGHLKSFSNDSFKSLPLKRKDIDLFVNDNKKAKESTVENKNLISNNNSVVAPINKVNTLFSTPVSFLKNNLQKL